MQTLLTQIQMAETDAMVQSKFYNILYHINFVCIEMIYCYVYIISFSFQQVLKALKSGTQALKFMHESEGLTVENVELVMEELQEVYTSSLISDCYILASVYAPSFTGFAGGPGSNRYHQ